MAAIGKFGPYVKHGKVFVSIPKRPYTAGHHFGGGGTTHIGKTSGGGEPSDKGFPEMPGLEVLNGKYGPYLAYKPEGARKATNYRLPKNTDAAVLTLEEAKKIMESQSTTKRPLARQLKRTDYQRNHTTSDEQSTLYFPIGCNFSPFICL